MRRAGGIIALIAGVMATIAGMITLFLGGVGSAFHASNAGTVVILGWIGLLGSFLTIVLGAIATSSRSANPGRLIVACAIISALFGGTLVAIFMLLALLGGILAIIPSSNSDSSQAAPIENVATPVKPGRADSSSSSARSIANAAAIVVIIAVVSAVGWDMISRNRQSSSLQSQSDPAANHYLGQSFSSGRFGISVNADIRSSVGNTYFQKSASAGAVYVAVTYRVTNITNTPISAFALPRVDLLDPQGNRYSADVLATTYYGMEKNVDAKFFDDLNPGLSLTKVQVFEVSQALFDSAKWQLSFVEEDDEYTVFLLEAPPSQEVAVNTSPEEQPQESDIEAPDSSSPPQSTDGKATDATPPMPVEDSEDSEKNTDTPVPTTVREPTTTEDDPGLATVRGFYAALERGDGDAAAKLVIPEKNKSGPLSAIEMSRFYANLKSPLVLLSVKSLGENEYRAKYSFTRDNGSECNGDAIISVVLRDGNPLIESIHTLHGC